MLDKGSTMAAVQHNDLPFGAAILDNLADFFGGDAPIAGCVEVRPRGGQK